MTSLWALLLASRLSLLDARRMAGATQAVQEAAVESEGKSCLACSRLTHLRESVGLYWGIFPPTPLPGYSMYFSCTPDSTVSWGLPEGLIEDALGSDCGLDSNEGLSASDQQHCREQYATTFKRAKWLGVPAAFLQQMAVCGRCTICTVFAKVRSLWQKIKAAVRKVVAKLVNMKQYLFGYSYAPSSVRKEMQSRFDAYFPDTDHQSSLLEVQTAESLEEAEHVRAVEDALWKQLAQKPQAEAELHLSLLQKKLEEAEETEEALLANAKGKVETETVMQQRQFEQRLPIMAHNEDCWKVMEASSRSEVLSLTLTVSYPNVASAIIHAVSLNVVGALHALIPSVSISASSSKGILHGAVDRCLEALKEAREPYLDKCTHEAPLMACTARTYQRLMQGALSQQWWPLMHNDRGTYGSIDLGYSYDGLMNSLKCSGAGSCLEKGLADLEKEEQVEFKPSPENESAEGMARFSELQCSFAGNRVDTEDAANNKLPVFSDKIWAAALKAHGSTVEEASAVARPCPSMLPFVVAFCASDLRCTEEAEMAGAGFFGPGELAGAQEKVAKVLRPVENSTRESVMAPYWTEREKLPRDRLELDDVWGMLVHPQPDLPEDEDAFEWSLLWRTANLTAELGLMPTWPRIFRALSAGGNNEDKSVDWVLARLYWERVLYLALRRLRVREAKAVKTHAKEKRSLAEVALNLQGIYETKFCSPGALGGLKEEHLHRLGVRDEVALTIHGLDSDDVVKGLWANWVVVNVKVSIKSTRKSARRFLELLRKHSCRCMCYTACDKLEASASANCQALWPSQAEEQKWRRPVLRAQKVVLDRVYRPGAKVLQDAELQVVVRPANGGCGAQVVVRPRRGSGQPLVGFPARCHVPDYFQKSSSLDFKMTLWTKPGRVNEPLEWQDFESTYRPQDDWGLKVDEDQDLFEEAPDLDMDSEDLSWLDELGEDMQTQQHTEAAHPDLDESIDNDFFDSLLHDTVKPIPQQGEDVDDSESS